MESEFEPSPEAAELLRQDPDRYSSLSHQQWMFLTYGDAGGGGGDDFVSQADAEAMWCVHRRLLLMSYRNSGKRPIAWWVIEHPELVWKGPDRQRSVLYEAGPGVLEEQERAELVNFWKREFDAAAGLDVDAQQKRYREADIPVRLRRMWQAARRRRGKTAREAKPEAVAVIPDPPEQPAA